MPDKPHPVAPDSGPAENPQAASSQRLPSKGVEEPSAGDAPAQEAAPGVASTDRLLQAIGPRELRCALLALLLPHGSRRALASWQGETIDETPYSTQLRDEALALQGSSRLPWFERLLVRMASQPAAERKTLLESTRRVVSARGSVQAIDTLHWLLMRRRLSPLPAQPHAASPDSGFSKLPEADVYPIARYSAFLSRMVPVDSPDGEGGAAWYASVMMRWQLRVEVPAQLPLPDSDALVQALQHVAGLPWMQRPVLMREWVSNALKHSPPGGLSAVAADALRMSCALLDTPLPPDLSRHYIEPYP